MNITHAGCVVFKKEENKYYFLIISSSEGQYWVLPKGHIEVGETSANAALRELEEETGVQGEIISELMIQPFQNQGEQFLVQYFLVKKLKDGQGKESRLVQWVDEKQAHDLLSFDDTKSILKAAANILDR